MLRVHLRRRPGRRTFEAYFTLDGRRVFKQLHTEDENVAEDLRAGRRESVWCGSI